MQQALVAVPGLGRDTDPSVEPLGCVFAVLLFAASGVDPCASVEFADFVAKPSLCFSLRSERAGAQYQSIVWSVTMPCGRSMKQGCCGSSVTQYSRSNHLRRVQQLSRFGWDPLV